jgi:hypothetical protein
MKSNKKPAKFNFEEALMFLKWGSRVSRNGWDDGTLLKCAEPTPTSDMTEPYIYMVNSNSLSVWVPTQEDLFAKDWVLIVDRSLRQIEAQIGASKK